MQTYIDTCRFMYRHFVKQSYLSSNKVMYIHTYIHTWFQYFWISGTLVFPVFLYFWNFHIPTYLENMDIQKLQNYRNMEILEIQKSRNSWNTEILKQMYICRHMCMSVQVYVYVSPWRWWWLGVYTISVCISWILFTENLCITFGSSGGCWVI